MYQKERKEKPVKKKQKQPEYEQKLQKIRLPCGVFLAMTVLAVLTGITQGKDQTFQQVKRYAPGGGMLETEAVVGIPQEETEYTVKLEIPERIYSRKQKKELLCAAGEEIAQTFCGKNRSMDEIEEDPVVKEQYQNGAVQAQWSFSGKTIDADGQIDRENWSGEPELTEASVWLQCGDMEEMYEFAFVICLKLTPKEQLMRQIRTQILEQDERNPVVELPGRADGKKLVWERPKEAVAQEIFLLGIFAGIAVWYVQKEKKQKKVCRRREQLLMEYPEFVSKLTLLLGAGMTIRGAMQKMDQMQQNDRREKRGRDSPVWEELHTMICEMENGMGELRAYREFAERCELQPYRKLSALLVMGQRMGNKKLLESLREEADRVFLERKNMARKLGEEAGTKLLLPMMLLLSDVMGIILIPAFLSVVHV